MSQQTPLGGAHNEEESQDALSGGLDVTPRAATKPVGGSSGNAKKFLFVGAIVLLIAVLGGIIFKGLNDASMFYYNVDEAVAKKAELGDKRFRMQGNVIDGSIVKTAEGVDFTVAFDNSQVHVTHRGAPPELFSPKIPVVLEGKFVGDEFNSDEIIIRHDNTYNEEHKDRIKRAENDADKRTDPAG